MPRTILAALLCIVISACNDEEAPVKQEHASTEKVLGFSLPDYAAGCHFHSESMMGLFAYLKCEVPSEALQEFLQTSPLVPDTIGDTKEPIPFATYNRGASWWNPSALNAPRYGVKRGQRGKWRTGSYIAVDRRPEGTVVYFMYIEEPRPRPVP